MLHEQQIKIGFNSALKKEIPFTQFHHIITDRGSKYSVTIQSVHSREEAQTFLKQVKKNKKYAKATHNTWALRVQKDGAIFESKNDDGETGAGNVMLRILQKSDAVNIMVVVTRWFGGVKLMGDRFKHVGDATKYALESIL